jgi:hypothetical protein
VFKDPVLQELIRQALNNNYDLRTAAARVEEARSQIGISRSFLYPQVNLNGGGSAQQVSRATDPPQSFGANRNFQNWLTGFGMVWEIDVFGRIRRESEAASAVYFASEMDRRGVYIVWLPMSPSCISICASRTLSWRSPGARSSLTTTRCGSTAAAMKPAFPTGSKWNRRWPIAPAPPR